MWNSDLQSFTSHPGVDLYDGEKMSSEPDPNRLKEAYRLLETSPELAVKELRSLIERGSLYSMICLGWAHQKRFAVDANAKEAESWFRLAFDKGSKQAIYYLGRFYLHQQEYFKAHEVLSVGIEKQYAPAIFWLGRMYLNGLGVIKQLDKARALYEQAAALDHVYAKRNLGVLLMSGHFGFFRIFRGFFLFLWAGRDAFIAGVDGKVSSDRFF